MRPSRNVSRLLAEAAEPMLHLPAWRFAAAQTKRQREIEGDCAQRQTKRWIHDVIHDAFCAKSQRNHRPGNRETGKLYASPEICSPLPRVTVRQADFASQNSLTKIEPPGKTSPPNSIKLLTRLLTCVKPSLSAAESSRVRQAPRAAIGRTSRLRTIICDYVAPHGCPRLHTCTIAKWSCCNDD